MAALVKVKNMTGEDRSCPWAGPNGQGAVIKAGEVGVVPQWLYDSLDWGHGHFEVVAEPKK